MCRNCGSIIGAGQQQCAVCGTRVGSAANPSQDTAPKDEAMRFARAVLNRPYKFTIALLVANIFVFILMWQSSGMNFSVLNFFSYDVLVAYGAKVNYLVREQHQWWRLITPIFIHINLLHLMVNMYSLWVVGPYVEKLYGSAKFVVFWIVTGIASIVASYLTVLPPDRQVGRLGSFLFKTMDAPSAGASGALFGLVGVLFVFGIKFRRELPEGFKRAFGVGMLPIIVINLIIGFLGRGFIDNAAHLGGLVAGILLALAAEYRRPGDRTSVSVFWRMLQALSLVIVVAGAYKIVRNFNRPIPPSPEQIARARHQTFLSFVSGMNVLQEQVSRIVHDNDASQVEVASQHVSEQAAPDARAAELRDRLLVILSKFVEASSKGQTDQRLMEEFETWHEDYIEWFKGAD